MMTTCVLRGAATALAALALASCALSGGNPNRVARAAPPPPDCKAWVGTDRDAAIPGYKLPKASGGTVCVPFLQTANSAPARYPGTDFHVEEFTDAKLKARWAACKADAVCFKRIDAQMQRWLPPNKERATRSTGVVDPSGKIDPDGAVDLRQIQRPAFIAKAPYNQAIAHADARTSIVEFTAPRDAFERIELHMLDQIKLRG